MSAGGQEQRDHVQREQRASSAHVARGRSGRRPCTDDHDEQRRRHDRVDDRVERVAGEVGLVPGLGEVVEARVRRQPGRVLEELRQRLERRVDEHQDRAEVEGGEGEQDRVRHDPASASRSGRATAAGDDVPESMRTHAHREVLPLSAPDGEVGAQPDDQHEQEQHDRRRRAVALAERRGERSRRLPEALGVDHVAEHLGAGAIADEHQEQLPRLERTDDVEDEVRVDRRGQLRPGDVAEQLPRLAPSTCAAS